MAVWVHLVLLPLLYLADGKPKPPGGASKKNFTEIAEDTTNSTENQIYHFDYNLFKNKTRPKVSGSRNGRKLIQDEFHLDQIEVKFNWKKLNLDVRVGTFFLLKDTEKDIENAILYPPNDESLIVRGLREAVTYSGEVRIIRDKEALEDLSKTREEDNFPFKFNSPRIINENEMNKVLDALHDLPKSKINLDSISINFKIPTITEHTILELNDVNEKNDSSKVIVHMTPRTISLVVNDIPSGTVLRVIMRKGDNITHKAYIFTGAVLPPSTLSHPLTKIFLPFGPEEERLTVKCFVKDKPPFQGFPCKGSNICIPLHWECDGEEDCVGGFDESRCDAKPSASRTTEKPTTIVERHHKCKRSEFSCENNSVQTCFPLSWLCDGRTDCSDGFDEKNENCRHRPPEDINATSFCDRTHFKCYRGGCVVNQRVCDGYKDCSDGSDESDCPEDEDEDEEDDEDDEDPDVLCDSKFEFTCDKRIVPKKCIPKPWVCDDQNDCPYGEDEDDRVCREHHNNFFD